MYANGQGVRHNDKVAAKWFRKSAKKGYAPAQFTLGVMYDDGRGVLHDEEKAIKWYRKAADQKYFLAQIMVKCIVEPKKIPIPENNP